MPPPHARKVARLVTAEAAQSNLKLAADGQLPSLQLQDTGRKDKTQGKSKTVSPLVLVAAWMMSVVATVAIVVYSASDSSDVTTAEQEKALEIIQSEYFGNPAAGELRPYQIYLREAHQARCRGDHKAEYQYYKKVLDLLRGASRSEPSRAGLEKGITGSRDHDRKLEQQILKILAE